MPDRLHSSVERIARERAAHRCVFCGESDAAHLDLVPAGGATDDLNDLLLVCTDCADQVSRGEIAPAEMRRARARLGAPVRMLGAPNDPVPRQSLNFTGTANGSMIANAINVRGDAKPSAKMAHPPGSIGADLDRKNYIAYLVDRYNEFGSAGRTSYGQKGEFHHGVIHENVRRKFKAKTYFIPVERFDDLVSYLRGRIDATIQGKRNRSRGRGSYSSYESHVAGLYHPAE